ncbi:MAG: DUF2007 domain-containing protein [bacterium]
MKKRGGEPVCVYSTQDVVEAEIIKGLLTSSGIPCRVQHDSVGSAYLHLLSVTHDIHLLVPAERAEEARALIDSRPGEPEHLE